MTLTNTCNIRPIMNRHTIGDGEHIVIDRVNSYGSYLVDACTGKRYLDLSSQFASQALGWNHPSLNKRLAHLGVAALHKYANSDCYSSDLADFVETFAAITPDFKHLFFVEGGTLAIENALKCAFDWKAQKLGLTENEVNDLDVIHFKQAFHGRSGYCLSLTNTVPNKTALFPKFKWTRVDNPKCQSSGNMEETEAKVVDQIRSHLIGGHKVAAIILETIQGEGGDNHFRPEFFKSLRQIADENEVLLILDEVQSGMGLTGKMWAYQHFGIVPDMICFGKKTQVCGFATTGRIDELETNVFKVSSRINSTWGGNIVDMVRSKYIIDIIVEEGLVANAADVGNYFLELLCEVPRITNVRGRGLMLAFDLETPETRNNVLVKLQEEATILPCGEQSIRIRPHLTFSKENVDEAVAIIKKAVS